MSTFHQLKAWVRHWLQEVDEHSIHSPYFFDFYRRVILDKSNSQEYPEIELLRSNLLVNPTVLTVEDLGAKSAVKGNKRTLADIAATSISSKERAELYMRILSFCDARRIVELGSCLGVTTLYLAKKKDSTVFTFEGSPALINVSLTNYEYFNTSNIHLYEGNIDTTLSEFLQDPAKISFVLMDANHRYGPTVKYFSMLMRRLNEKSIVVIDDIHSSAEMEKAWRELQHHEIVYGSIDLYGCGILLFEPSLNKQHYIWKWM